jgi:hypothetical protein
LEIELYSQIVLGMENERFLKIFANWFILPMNLNEISTISGTKPINLMKTKGVQKSQQNWYRNNHSINNYLLKRKQETFQN